MPNLISACIQNVLPLPQSLIKTLLTSWTITRKKVSVYHGCEKSDNWVTEEAIAQDMRSIMEEAQVGK